MTTADLQLASPSETELQDCDVASSSPGSWLSLIIIKASVLYVSGYENAEHLRIILRVLDWNKRLENMKVTVF
jgi:hypothetical protein